MFFLKVFVFAILPLCITFFIFISFSHYAYTKVFVKTTERELELMVGKAENFISEYIGKRHTALEGLAYSFALMPEMPENEFEAMLKAIDKKHDVLDTCYVGFATGRHLDSAWVQTAGYDPRTRDWYKGAQTKRGFYTTEIYVDANTKNLMISASFPIIKANKVNAVVATNLSLEPIAQMVLEAVRNEKSQISLLT